MNTRILILTLAVVAVNANPAIKWYEVQPALESHKDGEISESFLRSEWESFKEQYSKAYNEEEDRLRFRKFYKNYVMIEKHNAEEKKGLHTFTLGINEFADMDNLEFRMMMNGFNLPTNYSKTGSTFLDTTPYGEEELEDDDEGRNLPKEVDWRVKGYVTEIKHQGQCGSCYSFSTTGSLEGQHYKKTGKLISLSEQNIMDCSTKYGNDGCDGGSMVNSFRYIKNNKGVDTESSYPYKGYQQSSCKFTKEDVAATVTGYVELPQGNEVKLKQAAAKIGPISVAIDSSHTSFQFYKTGIYNEPSCSTKKLDHAVLVVGYGKKQKQPFWIVKNSWGSEWGENGYVRMSRNMNNQCGIATYPSYPLV